MGTFNIDTAWKQKLLTILLCQKEKNLKKKKIIETNKKTPLVKMPFLPLKIPLNT